MSSNFSNLIKIFSESVKIGMSEIVMFGPCVSISIVLVTV